MPPNPMTWHWQISDEKIIDIEIINKKDGVVRGILTILRAIKIGHKIYSSHKIKLVLFKFFTLLVGI